MPTGTIKRVFKDRGFGFIRTPDGQEIFFHRSGLRSTRFESIAEGDAVEFEVESTSSACPIAPLAKAACVTEVRTGCPTMLHAPGGLSRRTSSTTGWQEGKPALAIMHPTWS